MWRALLLQAVAAFAQQYEDYYVQDDSTRKIHRCTLNAPVPSCFQEVMTLPEDRDMYGLNVDGAGYIVAADYKNHVVARCFAGDGTCTDVAGQWKQKGDSSTRLNNPRYVVLAPNGDYVTADYGNNRVQRCPSSGVGACTTVAGHDGLGSGATELNQPYAVTMHPSGDYVVLDSGNHRVQRCAGSGSGPCSTVAGGNGKGSGFNQLADYATGVTLAPNGDYVIADYHNNRIQRCPADGSGNCTRVAGSDIQGSRDRDLWNPTEVLVYQGSDYIVADYVNHRIQHCPPENAPCTTIDGGNVGSPRSVLWVDSTTTTTMTSTATSRTVSTSTGTTETRTSTNTSTTTSLTDTTTLSTRTSLTTTASSRTTGTNTTTSITTNTTTTGTLTTTRSTATTYTTTWTSATSSSATRTTHTHTSHTNTKTSATVSVSATSTLILTTTSNTLTTTTTYTTSRSRTQLSTITNSTTVTETMTTTESQTSSTATLISTTSTTATATTTVSTTTVSSTTTTNSTTTDSTTTTTYTSSTSSSTTVSSTATSITTSISTTSSNTISSTTITTSSTNSSTTSTSHTFTSTWTVSNTSTSTTYTDSTTTVFRSAHRTNATLETLTALLAGGYNADVDVAMIVEELLVSMANYENSVTPAVLTKLLEVISVTMLGRSDTEPVDKAVRTLESVLTVANNSGRFIFTNESLSIAAGFLADVAGMKQVLEGPLDPVMLDNMASCISILVGAVHPAGLNSSEVADAAQLVTDAIVDSAARNLSVNGNVIVRAPGLEISVAKPSPGLWAAGQSFKAFRLPPLRQSAGSQWTLNQVRWDNNPFAHAGRGPFDVRLSGPGVTQHLSVRDKRQEVKISGLADPVRFCLARDLPINLPTSQKKLERTCAFWNVTEKRWSDSGCEATKGNETHFCCSCNHLTAFTAATKQALCHFCKLPKNDGPGAFYKFKFDEYGIWILLGMFGLLYLPCVYTTCRDCQEQKSTKETQLTFFTESFAGSDIFECMMLPPFRLCIGCLKFAPLVLTYPPFCCRRRRDNGELTLQGIVSKLSDQQDAVASATASALRSLQSQKAASERQLVEFSNLPLESQLQTIKAVDILWKSSHQCPRKLLSTTSARVVHPFLHRLERHVLHTSRGPMESPRRKRRTLEAVDEPGYVVDLFEVLDNPFKAIAHKVSKDELGVIATLKTGITGCVGSRFLMFDDYDNYVSQVLKIQAAMRAFLARRVQLPIAKGRMLQVMLRPSFGDPADQSLRSLGAKRAVLRIPEGKEPSGGQAEVMFPEIVVVFEWEFIPQACANVPKDVLFGQLSLTSVMAQCRVTEVAFGDEIEGQRVALTLEVKTGIRTRENWVLPVQDVDPTSEQNCVRWRGGERWFNIWHFMDAPLVRVEISGKGGQKDEVAFLYLPNEAQQKRDQGTSVVITEDAMVQAKRPHPPDRMITEILEPSSLVPVDGQGWSRLWKLSAGDGSQRRSEGKVEIDYTWNVSGDVGTLQVHRVAWKALPSKGYTSRQLRLLIQRAQPILHEETLIVREVPESGKVKFLDTFDLRADSFRRYREMHLKDDGEAYISGSEVLEIIERVQYLTWPACRIIARTIRRETPLNACCGYSALISRKQRYAVLSSGVLLAGFFAILLFNVDCGMEPMPVACKPKSIYQRALSWYAMSAAVWGVLLSLPMPILLRLLFKKRVIVRQMSEAQRALMTRIWQYKHTLAWFLVFLIHFGSWFTFAGFVRYYSWTMMEQWLSAVAWSLILRFIVAPAVCTLSVMLLLLLSRASRCLDCLAGNAPHLTSFPDPVPGVMQRQELYEVVSDNVAVDTVAV